VLSETDSDDYSSLPDLFQQMDGDSAMLTDIKLLILQGGKKNNN